MSAFLSSARLAFLVRRSRALRAAALRRAISPIAVACDSPVTVRLPPLTHSTPKIAKSQQPGLARMRHAAAASRRSLCASASLSNAVQARSETGAFAPIGGAHTAGLGRCRLAANSVGPSLRMRPNPSLEPTRSGKAPWPPRAK